jgi:hypothetical protein
VDERQGHGGRDHGLAFRQGEVTQP